MKSTLERGSECLFIGTVIILYCYWCHRYGFLCETHHCLLYLWVLTKMGGGTISFRITMSNLEWRRYFVTDDHDRLWVSETTWVSESEEITDRMTKCRTQTLSFSESKFRVHLISKINNLCSELGRLWVKGLDILPTFLGIEYPNNIIYYFINHELWTIQELFTINNKH